MKKEKIYLFVFFAMIALIDVLASCKKDYIKTPFNQIEEFSVTDSLGNKLKASITGDSLIVYWPPFQTAPAQVTPQITVASGATISPASGTKVAFASTTVYTVTAQDGSNKTYKLIPLINQPAPVFSVAGADGLQLGTYIVLNGQYIIPDTTTTKLYFVNSSNKDIPVSLTAGLYHSISTFKITFQMPQDNSLDTGYYKLKLISGKNKTINGPYHFGLPSCPAFTTTQTGPIQRGKTLTFSLSGPFAKYYYTSFVGGQLTLYIGDNFDMVNAVVNSQNNGTITVVIPQYTPLGLLEGIDFSDKNGNLLQSWFPNSPNITITQ